ncbi:MAG: hypothetical protein KatS3mg002_1648 [Candidatus Woesearchaeota archaeon]|nr:MAG: hypothetical protein KatS3mg002_1648 [Candidatus Woesearchaeota archaeon]
MKNIKILILLLISSFSCTITNTSNINNIPSPLPTSNNPKPTISLSSLPSSKSTEISTLISDEDNFRLALEGDGYIYTPETSFLTINPLEISLSLYLNQLPENIYTIFEIYNTENKNTYLSLNLDKDKNFILNFLGTSEKIAFNNFELNKKLEIKIIKDNKKVNFSINGNILIDKEFNINDNKNKKVLFIGSDSNENNKIKAEYGYFIIKDILTYNFTRNILDDGNYKLDALYKGNYKLTPIEIKPSNTPIPSPTPSISPSITIVERNDVKTVKASKQIIDLNVILSSSSSIDNKVFYTRWFDLENRTFLENNQIGDIRFYTLLSSSGDKKVFIQGRLEKPETYIIDLGIRKFEGILDITDLDFQKEQLINKDKDKAELYNDHSYAIQTFRYGKPRYAKLFVNQIITQNFDFSKMKPPEIKNQPSFVNAGQQTSFLNNTNYKYYVSSYDGYGETTAIETNQISSSDTTNKKVTFSFFLPYRAKGYFIYKEFNGKIYKSGPFYGEAEKENIYEDLGFLGREVNSLPTENTTIFSSYKQFGEIPIKLEFTYSFNGEPELKTFFSE